MSQQTQFSGQQVIEALAEQARQHRSIPDIQEDLDEARARHRELMPKVEQEGVREQKQKEKIAKAQLKWKVENPDEPFDPRAFTPPMVPYKANEELCAKFHALHYTIADFERELDAAQKARAAGVK